MVVTVDDKQFIKSLRQLKKDESLS